MKDTDIFADIDFDDLMAPTKTFKAEGETYKHREKFKAWGWYWSDAYKAWLCDGETSSDCARVNAIKELDGVRVSELEHVLY